MVVLVALMIGVTMYRSDDSAVEEAGWFGVSFHSRMGGNVGIHACFGGSFRLILIGGGVGSGLCLAGVVVSCSVWSRIDIMRSGWTNGCMVVEGGAANRSCIGVVVGDVVNVVFVHTDISGSGSNESL